MPTPPVEERELLYRQIHPGGNPIYFDPAHRRPVHQSVFLPSRDDTDGLSLIRAILRTEIWSAHRWEQPNTRFRLACLRLEFLIEVGYRVGFEALNFVPTPDGLDQQHGEPWAHCVVAEINRISYDADKSAKRRIKEWALGVANGIASEAVLGPFAPPTLADEYRPN